MRIAVLLCLCVLSYVHCSNLWYSDECPKPANNDYADLQCPDDTTCDPHQYFTRPHTCAPGQLWQFTENDTTTCFVDTYSSNNEISVTFVQRGECKKCPDGKTSDQILLNAGKTTFTGTWLEEHESRQGEVEGYSCFNCSNGQYSRNQVSEACPKFSASPEGSTEISDCLCDTGYFGSSYGDRVCRPCPENSNITTPVVGTQKSDC